MLIIVNIMRVLASTRQIASLHFFQYLNALNAKMTVLTGRRRAGKTLLALHFAKNKPFLYLFVTKKSETLLCQDFIEDIDSLLSKKTV